MSQALRDTIPVMNLVHELHNRGFEGEFIVPKVYCKAFEDNMEAIELAKTPKMRPRTKHINLVYHHFRDQVGSETIDIESVSSENQIADMLTKPLQQNVFVFLRKKLLPW